MSIHMQIQRRQTWVRKETLNNLFQSDQSVKIGSFDEALETWYVYKERVELYLKANGVSEELLVPSFLAVIGAKTYGL